MSINMAALANAPELPSETITLAIPEDVIWGTLELLELEESIQINDETVIELGEGIPSYGISEGQLEDLDTIETYPLFVDDVLVALIDVTSGKNGKKCYITTQGEDTAEIQQAVTNAGTSVDCIIFIYAADGIYFVTPSGEVYLAMKAVAPQWGAIEETKAKLFAQKAGMEEARTRTVLDSTEEAVFRVMNPLGSKLLDLIAVLMEVAGRLVRL